jgi:eukaryotic-like serine/threonine-protein kinase
VGTPEYMSPEQARAEKLDFRSDIYSLGVVIYEIFTGTVPFQGDTPIATLMKHLNEPPPLRGPDAAALPEPLVAVLARTLSKDPDGRYGEAAELVTAIRDAYRDATRTTMPEVLTPPTGVTRIVPPSVAMDATGTRTTVSADPTPLPSSAAPSTSGTGPWPRWPWRWWPVAALAVALALGVLARLRTDRTPPSPQTAAAVATATLVIDALPWAEVERIEDGAGRPVDAGPDRSTPFVATLPPGDYTVSVRRPESARAETLRITLRAGQVERRVVEFERIDADEYLENAGF